ncbi:MAG: protein kinase [Gemmatimonadetes bacterium]|nr:protein kinase [Gemmatimonadota bacterium]
MPDLIDRLKTALAGRYAIERELGAGGMATVYLAEDVKHERKVAVKVLRPDLAAALGPDRFLREIKIAAQLHHPHILPLHDSGEADGFLYYVMPYEEGQSLRERLEREGELPVGEAVRLLRDVVDALAHAHERGVVHRDIKPDNIMQSGRHALVTDFGIAKAVSEATGRQQLTTAGVALGTPAYMAPEQAVADPHIDHRADIYAVGALAYELLTGRPPFTGATPQAVLSAHVTQVPDPVTKHREAVPPALAQLVMKCLEKKPADRWQSAEELLASLEAVMTSSVGITPTDTQPVQAAAPLVGQQNNPVRVAALFGIAAATTLVIVYALMIGLGLPDWVFVGAIALLAIGLPIVMVTGHHERLRAVALTTGLHVPTPTGLQRHFTWRKAILGGGMAFVGLSVLAGGYMTMRGMGIGPVGTLMATGVLGQRELIILAEFDNRTTDSTLAATVTDLLRISLSESPVLRIADPARLSESLDRMKLPPGTRVGEAVAREIAERENLKAVLAGEVVSLGSGYLVSGRLVSATGEVLTEQQASAADAGELIAAVDELSRKLRERIGESLRSIRRTLPLELVTTGSLRALRLYSQATRAEISGDNIRAVVLLEEAVAEDSSFAMAYRKIATVLNNDSEQRGRAIEAATRAYELRDRLTEIERGYTIANYHTAVTGRRDEALAAYRTILDKYPEDHRALNNSGVLYVQLGDDGRAREFYQRALDLDSTWSVGFTNLAWEHKNLGYFAEAAATLDAMEARFPGNPRTEEARGFLAMAQRDFAAAEQHFTNVRDSQRGNPGWEGDAAEQLAFLAATRGRFRSGDRQFRHALSMFEQREMESGRQRLTVEWEMVRTQALGIDRRALTEVESVVATDVMASLPLADRDYEGLIVFFVMAGEVERARGLLRDMELSGQPALSRDLERSFDRAAGWVALADGEIDRGLARLRDGIDGWACGPCGLNVLALAHDVADNPDSSLSYWEQYLDTNWGIPGIDSRALPVAYRRLGELYEQRGNRDKAVRYYNEFVELWKDADPELLPQVEEARRRIAILVGESPASNPPR